MPQMDETIVQPAAMATATSEGTTTTGWLLVVVAFGLLWFELVNQLKGEWWLNPQYNYGLIVPVLLIYLLWKRWQSRPSPTIPARRILTVIFILAAAAVAEAGCGTLRFRSCFFWSRSRGQSESSNW